MGTTTSAVCDVYKTGVMTKVYNHTATTGDVFDIALIKASPTGSYGESTTNYSQLTGNSDETSGTGYTAGGFAWTAVQNITPAISSGVATTSWSVNPTWTSATFTTQAALLYDSTASGAAVAVYDFGGSQSVTNGTFTLILPTNNGTSAILRIA